jgi:hypothetical protein
MWINVGGAFFQSISHNADVIAPRSIATLPLVRTLDGSGPPHLALARRKHRRVPVRAMRNRGAQDFKDAKKLKLTAGS